MIPIISIIVPVYKTEQYLHECLDSVLAQTYTDWECLLIDDGSPDDCGVICDEYANRDSRFRVFHKENGGVSSARNVGLDNCVGEYVTFVDSDDTIAPDYLEAVDDFEGDLMILGYTRTDSNIRKPDVIADGVYEETDLPNFYYTNLGSEYMRLTCFKIFRKSLIGKLRYDTNVRFCEDTLFNLTYYSRCKCVKVVTSYKYHYKIFENKKDYWHTSADTAIYTLCATYEEYKKLAVDIPNFVLAEYYFFRQMIEWNVPNVNKWFNNPTVKDIYTKHINSSLCFQISYLRWWIVAVYKYCVNK